MGLLVLSACISFKLKPFPAPENLVESFLFAKDVDASGELLKPVGEQAEFPADEGRVLCFVRLRGVGRPVRIRWKWYGPDMKLARDSGDVDANMEGKFLEVVTAYDALRLATESATAGRWTAAFFIDGRLAARRSFQVN